MSSYYFAYIRPKQGMPNQKQRLHIRQYAKRRGLAISEWFEEQPCSAMGRRPAFARMLKGLKGRKAAGVISDARDRFARRLDEAAKIAELADRGVQFHFTNHRPSAYIGQPSNWHLVEEHFRKRVAYRNFTAQASPTRIMR